MIRAISDTKLEDFSDGFPVKGSVAVTQEKSRMQGPAKRIALTKRQREIYEFLRDKITIEATARLFGKSDSISVFVLPTVSCVI